MKGKGKEGEGKKGKEETERRRRKKPRKRDSNTGPSVWAIIARKYRLLSVVSLVQPNMNTYIITHVAPVAGN